MSFRYEYEKMVCGVLAEDLKILDARSRAWSPPQRTELPAGGLIGLVSDLAPGCDGSASTKSSLVGDITLLPATNIQFLNLNKENCD